MVNVTGMTAGWMSLHTITILLRHFWVLVAVRPISVGGGVVRTSSCTFDDWHCNRRSYLSDSVCKDPELIHCMLALHADAITPRGTLSTTARPPPGIRGMCQEYGHDWLATPPFYIHLSLSPAFATPHIAQPSIHLPSSRSLHPGTPLLLASFETQPDSLWPTEIPWIISKMIDAKFFLYRSLLRKWLCERDDMSWGQFFHLHLPPFNTLR